MVVFVKLNSGWNATGPEFIETLVEAGFKRLKPDGTYYSHQELSGPYPLVQQVSDGR